MCARYPSIALRPKDVARVFDADLAELFDPKEDVRPTDPAPIVVREEGERKVRVARWGLVPSWAEDAKIGSRLFNARAETLAEKPAFRGAYRARRCLIPANGFFEWKNGVRHLFTVKDTPIFAFAGLWETWHPEQENLRTYTMVTTVPNEAVQPFHDRMPAILTPDQYDRWLDPAIRETGELSALLAPVPSSILVCTAAGEAEAQAQGSLFE
ncbi:MAG TPA: SOS response-associated peptidase [Fimbriimonas sp.]